MLNQEQLLNTQLMKLINDELKKNPSFTKFNFSAENESDEAFELLEQVKKEMAAVDKQTLEIHMAE